MHMSITIYVFSLATFYFIDMENTLCVFSTKIDFAYMIIGVFTSYVSMYRPGESVVWIDTTSKTRDV